MYDLRNNSTMSRETTFRFNSAAKSYIKFHFLIILATLLAVPVAKAQQTNPIPSIQAACQTIQSDHTACIVTEHPSLETQWIPSTIRAELTASIHPTPSAPTYDLESPQRPQNPKITETPLPGSGQKTDQITKAVIGGIVGAITLVFAIILVVIWLCCFRKKAREDGGKIERDLASVEYGNGGRGGRVHDIDFDDWSEASSRVSHEQT